MQNTYFYFAFEILQYKYLVFVKCKMVLLDFMFVEDSDSSVASDNANTSIDPETLQYLKDDDNTLESLNRCPNAKTPP